MGDCAQALGTQRMTELDCELPTHRGHRSQMSRGDPQEEHSVREEENVLINEMAKVRDARNKPALICEMPRGQATAGPFLSSPSGSRAQPCATPVPSSDLRDLTLLH